MDFSHVSDAFVYVKRTVRKLTVEFVIVADRGIRGYDGGGGGNTWTVLFSIPFQWSFDGLKTCPKIRFSLNILRCRGIVGFGSFIWISKIEATRYFYDEFYSSGDRFSVS